MSHGVWNSRPNSPFTSALPLAPPADHNGMVTSCCESPRIDHAYGSVQGPYPRMEAAMTSRIKINVFDSELFAFAQMAHQARFPDFAWKAIACDMMGIPMGSRPTLAQMANQPHSATTLWLQLTLRFDQLTTVRYEEFCENAEERIHNTLLYLGSTSKRIGDHLKLMGVMGDAMESCDCPLAHYFEGIAGAWFVKVFREHSWVDFVECSNPMAVENFVWEFDQGRRSDLDLFPDRAAIL